MTADRNRRITLPLVLLFLFSFVSSRALAQYVETNLDTNTSDPNLVNGWGLSFFPSSPFWISDQNTSVATLYAADGTVVPLVVQIPCIVSGTPTAPCPNPASPSFCP